MEFVGGQASALGALLLAEGEPIATARDVASRTLAGPLAWQGSTLVTEALAEGITSVKERHDEVHVIGSLNLVQSLLRLDLVDRLHVVVRVKEDGRLTRGVEPFAVGVRQ